MPQGNKSSYAAPQKHQTGYSDTVGEKKNFSTKASAGRAWATINKLTGGGGNSGSGSKEKGWLFVHFSQEPADFTPDLGRTNKAWTPPL
jgi:hypothetical protein